VTGEARRAATSSESAGAEFGGLCRELQAKPDRPNTCWRCGKGGFIISLNVTEELASLGVRIRLPQTRVGLCVACTVQYLNSFNFALHRHKGDPSMPELWTVESLLRSMRSQ
jgi:hypothetical protein